MLLIVPVAEQPASAHGGEGGAGGVHRAWGGIFSAETYLANGAGSGEGEGGEGGEGGQGGGGIGVRGIAPFRQNGSNLSKLSRRDGAEAVRRAAVLGRGVFASLSLIGGAGLGLFAARRYERGDVITVYDGVMTQASALQYDSAQRAYHSPKVETRFSAADNPAWRFGDGLGFQSHWKDAGTTPSGNLLVLGFGGWPLGGILPEGMGAGALANAVRIPQ